VSSRFPSFGENPGFQERLHQRAYPLILDPRPEAVHQSRMINFVETGSDVALQYPLVIAGPGGEEMDFGDRVLRTPVRTEPVRARLEIRLEDGFEHQLQACLDHAVSDGGNAEFPEFPIRLRYHYLPYLNRPEPARLQRVTDLTQESPDPDPGLDSGRSGLVDTRSPGALVGGHAFPRVHQERRVVNEVVQIAETAGRIFSRPAVQLGLHPPYRKIRRTGIRPLHGAGIHQRVYGHYIPP